MTTTIDKSYTQTILIDTTPQKTFEAITAKLNDWWGKTNSSVSKVGDKFTIQFGKAYWKFSITEYVPNKNITWKCIDGRPAFHNEWVGTTLYWNIELSGDKTKVAFTHDGLTPAFKCYDICAPTWDMFITKSLKSFLETGKGTPQG